MSLLASLRNSADAMWVLQQATRVIQNNVANVSTPGYAKQRELFSAKSFDQTSGLSGGVRWDGAADSRSSFAEQAVRSQMSQLGFDQKRSQALSQLESALPIGENAGVAGAINKLLQAFSTLTVSPNDMAARQVALDRAAEVARVFNQTGNQLASAATSAYNDLRNTVAKVNALGDHLRDINVQIRQNANAQADSGLQADLHNTLEELSSLTGATTLFEDDGTVSVYLGGQNLFVQGPSHFPIQATMTSGAATVTGLNGQDISGILNEGQIGALLDLHNNTIPSFMSGLNQLAATFADRVNTTLAGGVDTSGNPPSTPLFSYNATLGEARTLQINSLTPQDLALAGAGAPGGNGNAMELVDLFNDKSINGFSFAGFYGTLAAQLGREVSSAREGASIQQSLLQQAQNLRDEASRVSLDEEAIALLEFQRSYQAIAQMITTLDDMTQTVIGMLR